MTHSVEYGQPGERTTQTGFEMPAPTLLPLALAFGLMLAFLGLIFHLYLVYVGVAVAFSAAIGWWRAVIPAEAHEQVALDPAHRPSPVLMRPEAVIRLKPGESLHRVHLPHEAHSYSSGIIGGLAGGCVMAVLACIYGLIAQHSIWFPVNLLAGVVLPSMGSETLEQLRAFDGSALLAACLGHIALSILVGVLYAITLPMFPRYAFFWAGILMPLVWSGVVATLLNLLNPALNSRINWPSYVLCQLAFGLVCGFVIARSERIKTLQSWTLAERAGIVKQDPQDFE